MSSPATLTFDAKGQPWRLTFKFGTMRMAEQELGRPLPADMAGGNIGFDLLSGLFWAALQPAHRMSREGAEDLIDEIGPQEAMALIGEGLGRYFGKGDAPAPDDAAGEPEGEPGKKKGKGG